MYGAELVEAFRRDEGDLGPGQPDEPAQGRRPLSDRLQPEARRGLRAAASRRRTSPTPRTAAASPTPRCAASASGKCRDDRQRHDVPELHGRPATRSTRPAAGRGSSTRCSRATTITDGFRSDEVHDALDLCLSCKGCKGDCPVSVDMATYKAEFLSHHYKRRLRPPPGLLDGADHVPRAARAARAPARQLAHPDAGDLRRGQAARRDQPEARDAARSRTRHSRPGSQRRGAVNPNGDPVVLFPDTFNNFLHPEPMKAAVEVLEAAGFRVVVPTAALCCGRPLYDYGMLDTAKRLLAADARRAARRRSVRDVPVVGVEPSCVAAFRDELPSLIAPRRGRQAPARCRR